MAKHLIIDATNILFRVAAVQKDKVFDEYDLARNVYACRAIFGK
jgi:hypothetical protein